MSNAKTPNDPTNRAASGETPSAREAGPAGACCVPAAPAACCAPVAATGCCAVATAPCCAPATAACCG